MIAKMLSNMAQLHCEFCKAQLPLEDLKSNGDVECKACHKVVSITKLLGAQSELNLDKSNVLISPEIKQYQEQGGRVIERRWWTATSSFITGFAAIWSGAVGIGVYVFFVAGPGHLDASLMLAAFVGLFGLVGLFLIYSALQQIFNSTKVIIGTGTVKLVVGPICFSNKITEYNSSDIINLAIEKHSVGTVNGKKVMSYRLNLVLKNDATAEVLPTLSLIDAIALEKIIENILGLKDRPELDRKIAG